MLKILAVVQTGLNDSLCFTTDHYGYTYIRSSVDINITYYLLVEDTDTFKRYYVNLSEAIREVRSIAESTTWEHVEQALSIDILSKYKTPAIIPTQVATSNVDVKSTRGGLVGITYSERVSWINNLATVLATSDSVLDISVDSDIFRSYSEFTLYKEWVGYIEAKVTGTHTFYLTSSTGNALYVNGTNVAKSWSAGGIRTGTVTLEAGRRYPIKLSYIKSGTTSNLDLEWSADTLTREQVPMEQLLAPEDMLETPLSFPPTVQKRTIEVTPADWTSETDRPTIISLGHSNMTDIGFTTISKPSNRNDARFYRSWTDLVYTHREQFEHEVNFDNCIPVVNGRVYRPQVIGGELFVEGGMLPFLSQLDRNFFSLLIDFSTIGNLDTIGLSECVYENTDRSIMFDLPPGKSLIGKAFMLVIDGRLFTSDECTVHNHRRISMRTDIHDLAAIRLSNLDIDGTYTRRCTTLQSGAIDTAYLDKLFSDTSTDNGNFIILIDSDELRYAKLTPDHGIHNQQLMFPAKSGGLLLRNRTREIVDYIRDIDSGGIQVSYDYSDTLKRLHRIDGSSKHIGFLRSKLNVSDCVIDVDREGFTMLDIFKGVIND